VTVRERALDVLTALRPQAYGKDHPSSIRDPIVEPMWTGVRVLAAIDGRDLRLQDGDGDPVNPRPDIAAALVDAVRAEGVIVDGYLTKDTGRDVIGADPGLEEIPSMGKFMTQSFFGTRRNRSQEVVQHIEQVREASTFDDEDSLGFVAVDLLWLDGEPLLDVPLLERRRLLETVIAESDLIRIGVFVRLPIDTWVASWRALGFIGLTFRAANSRYHPGEKRKEWTTSWMPRR
jgi:ATP-dependent DNA ligase